MNHFMHKITDDFVLFVDSARRNFLKQYIVLSPSSLLQCYTQSNQKPNNSSTFSVMPNSLPLNRHSFQITLLLCFFLLSPRSSSLCVWLCVCMPCAHAESIGNARSRAAEAYRRSSSYSCILFTMNVCPVPSQVKMFQYLVFFFYFFFHFSARCPSP